MDANPTASIKLVLLGTGSPNAEPDRSGPSVAIIAGGRSYLVDFGSGVVRQASKAFYAGIEELAPNNLRTAFLTHLHSDHTAGYPDLILTPWVLGRDEPLEVYGPSGLASMTENILSAYSSDIRERATGLQPSNDEGWKVIVHEIDSGEIFRDGDLNVEACRAVHGSLVSFSFKFRTPERTITISGDTAPSDEIIDFYRGSDVLVHEVYSSAGFEKYPPEWQKYHSAVHTSSRELAKIASEAKPGLLVLYHQLYNGVTDTELMDEIRTSYDGEVVSGKDLDVF